MTRSDDIDTLLPRIDQIAGWLRPAQARLLWELAAAAEPGGRVVEIGSYQGKSTVVLASAVAEGVEVVAIDPHAGNDRGPGEWEGAPEDGQADHMAFCRHLEEFGVADRVRHVRQFSQQALADAPGPIQVLYVDGAHGYRPALSDIVDWGGRVVPGGAMAIHDTFTSVFVTLAVLRSLVFSGRWRYVGRERSLAMYRREPVRGVARFTNAARQLAQLGWFARNQLVRALKMARLEQLARLLGHTPGGGLY